MRVYTMEAGLLGARARTKPTSFCSGLIQLTISQEQRAQNAKNPNETGRLPGGSTEATGRPRKHRRVVVEEEEDEEEAAVDEDCGRRPLLRGVLWSAAAEGCCCAGSAAEGRCCAGSAAEGRCCAGCSRRLPVARGVTAPPLSLIFATEIIMKADTPKFFFYYFWGSKDEYDLRNLGYYKNTGGISDA